MKVSAQISIYPLRQEELSPAVNAVREALKASGLTPVVGPMSTFVTGDSATVFSAIQEAPVQLSASEGKADIHAARPNVCL
jgi:uncharacterized protein YqgV (UPF0045/DUF77 family)